MKPGNRERKTENERARVFHARFSVLGYPVTRFFPSGLVLRMLAGNLRLHVWVAADVLVQVVLVDVDHLDAAALDLDRERLARLLGLGPVDGALPVAVV